MRVLALVALAMVTSPAAAQPAVRCEVRGRASVDGLRVRIDGHRIRTLAVRALPVAVDPGRGNTYRTVRVLEPLAFSARTSAPIPFTVPAGGELAGGALWLPPGFALHDVREGSEGALEASLALDATTRAERVAIACERVAAGSGAAPERVREPEIPRAGGVRWIAERDQLWIRAAPEDGSGRLRLTIADREALVLTEGRRQGEMVEVFARFASGAVLRGWTLAQDLVAAPRRGRSAVATRRAEAAPGPRCNLGPLDAGSYRGQAALRFGAAVRTSAGGTVWARAAEGARAMVELRPGEEWVRVLEIEGLFGDDRCPALLRQVWVARGDVTLGAP